MIPAHWNEEIRLVIAGARHHAEAHKRDAVIGVAVDDARKRDYFKPQLQAVLNHNPWARALTFRLVPMNGDAVIELRAKGEA